MEPARFPSGLTQNTVDQPLGQIGVPDPSFCIVDLDDFVPWKPNGWVVAAPTGTTINAVAGHGGLVQITSPSTSVASCGFQRAIGAFIPDQSSRISFMTRFRMDVANTGLFCGLADPTGDPFKTDDETSIGFFLQANWNGDISFETYVGGAQTLEYNLSFLPIVGQWYDLGWSWNPVHRHFELVLGQDLFGPRIGASSAKQQPVARVYADLGDVPSSLVMAPSFGIQVPGAANEQLSCDFMCCIMER